MKRILFYFVLISLISCEKEDINDNSVPHVYSDAVVLEKQLPFMGGVINSSGALISFTPPFLGDNPFNIQIPATLSQISPNGEIETLYEFLNENFYWGNSSIDTIGGVRGWVPSNIRIDIAMKEESLLMTYNDGNKIYKLTEAVMTEIEAMKGIISITSNHDGKVFFITSPIYGSHQNNSPLQTPPIIYEIDDLNNIQEYFRFPTDITYIHRGQGGSDAAMYPSDILINLSMDYDNNLYICFGYNNIVYKINNDKELLSFITDIYCPTSICFDKKNIPFVVSAPKFNLYDSNNDYDLYVVQSVEVFKLMEDSNEKIYTGNNVRLRGGYAPDVSDIYYNIDNANYNLSINNNNEIYLEDPKDYRIVLIK